MHFSGSRRARGIAFLFCLATLFALWRVSRLYVAGLVERLPDLLIRQAEQALQREIHVDRVLFRQPGRLVVEGVHVARTQKLHDGEIVAIQRVEVTYDPSLLEVGSLITRAVGRNTRAQIHITGIRMPQLVPGIAPPLLDVKSASTEIDIGPALRGSGNPVAGIDHVDVDGAHATVVRRADMHWNYEPLFHMKKPGKPSPFRGEIRIHHGTLDLLDYHSGELPAPAHNQAEVVGTVRFAAAPTIQFDGNGRVLGEHGGPVSISGSSNPKIRHWIVTANGELSSARYWFRYFTPPNQKAVDVISGSGSATVTLWDRPEGVGHRTSFAVDLDVRNGAARVTGTAEPIQDFRGRIAINPAGLWLHGTGRAGDLMAEATGEVLFAQPGRTSIQLRSPRVTLAALERLFPRLPVPPGLRVAGAGAAAVTLTGAPDGWSLQGTAQIPRGGFRELDLAAIRTNFEIYFDPGQPPHWNGDYQANSGSFRGTSAIAIRGNYRIGDRVVEATAEFQSLGGQVTASAWANTDETPWRIYGHARVSNVDLAQLPFASEDGPQVRGRAGADLVLAGTADAPEVSAYFHATPVTVNDETIQEFSGRLRYRDGAYEIPYAALRDPRIEASAAGTISAEGNLQLTVTAGGVDLASLLKDRTVEPIHGRAWVRAMVGGTMKAPTAEGSICIYQPGIREYDGEYAEGHFQEQDGRSVQVFGLKLRKSDLVFQSERVDLAKDPNDNTRWTVATEFTVQGLTIPRALLLAGASEERVRSLALSGRLDPVHVTVSGPVNEPQIGLRVSGNDIAYSGIDVGTVQAEGRLDVPGHRLFVSQLTARSPSVHVDGSGTITYDPDAKAEQFAEHAGFDLSFDARAIQLRPWLRRYVPALAHYAIVSGDVEQLSGSVRGTMMEPSVRARATLHNLVVNNRVISVEPVEFEWAHDTVLTGPLRAKVGSGSVSVPFLAADLRPAGKEPEDPLDRLGTAITADAVPIAVLRQLLEDSPAYGSDRLRPVREALAQWKSAIGGEVTASIDIPLDAAKTPPHSAGQAASLFQRRERPATLLARASSSDLASPPEPGAILTQATGSLWMRDGHIHLDELRLQQSGGLLLTVSGDRMAPVSARDKDGGKLALTVKGTGLQLGSLIRLPISGLKERVAGFTPLEGTLQLQGEVTGTDQAPEVSFSLNVDRPMVAGLPFDQFVVSSGRYSGHEGVLRMVSAKLSKRLPDEEAAVLLSGALPLTWPDFSSPRNAERSLTVEIPPQSLTVFSALAGQAEVEAKKRGQEATEQMRPVTRILHELAATEGRMEGRFTLGGTALRPRNDGHLALTDARFHWDGMQTEIRELNARVDLSGDLVRLTQFSGQSSRGGSFAGGGTIRLGQDINGGAAARLDLTFAVNQFKFVEKKVASFLGEAFTGSQVQGSLTTVNPGMTERVQPLTITGEWPSPTIAGGLLLDDASLVLAFQEAAAGVSQPLPGDPRLNIRLIAGKSVWLHNPGIRLQLRDSVLASNTLQQPMIAGTLQVPTGTLSVSGLRLRNAEGQIRINYDARAQSTGVSPPPPIYVDLTASTSIRVQRSTAVEADYYDTTFQIRGYPGGGGDASIRPGSVAGGLSVGSEGGLTLTVRTDPPLPSREIEALIRQQLGVEGFAVGGANSVEAVRSQLEQAFAVNLSAPFAGRIEDFLQETFKLSTISLDVGVTQPLRVRIGKHLFGPLFGTFSQEFGSVQNQWAFEIYYRINPQLRIGYRQEEPFERKIIFFSGVKSF